MRSVYAKPEEVEESAGGEFPFTYGDDIPMMRFLRNRTRDIAEEEGLNFGELYHKKKPYRILTDGACGVPKGKDSYFIFITVRYRTPPEFGSEWDDSCRSQGFLVDTLCHEIAHINHSDHDSDVFKEFKIYLYREYFPDILRANLDVDRALELQEKNI